MGKPKQRSQPKQPKAKPSKGGLPTSPKSKRPRQAEEATSPGTDSSNGG